MTRFIGSIFGVLALATMVAASNCHVQRVVLQQHHVPYVAPVVAVHHDYGYRISYNPDGDLADAVKILVEELRTERQENREWKARYLRDGGTGGGPLPLKAEALTAKHPPAQSACVNCHDASVSKTKGDGITLYNGGILLDTPENVGRMVEAVTEKQTMPRGVKWGAQERLDFLRSLVVKTEAAK